jgi:hypothetical protein
LSGLGAGGRHSSRRHRQLSARNQRFLDLEPCTLALQLLPGRALRDPVRLRRDAKVVQTLEREFGEPTMRESYGHVLVLEQRPSSG